MERNEKNKGSLLLIMATGFLGETSCQRKLQFSFCIKCGKCEKACLQHLEICKLFEDVTREFKLNKIKFRIWGKIKYAFYILSILWHKTYE